MARSRQHLHVCTVVPLDGPALGVAGNYASVTKPVVGMSVTVHTRPSAESIQPHEYRVVEIRDQRVTNADTQLMARHVRSGEPQAAPPPAPSTMHGTPP